MFTHLTMAAAIATAAVDPATLGERDVAEAMAAISEAILDAHHPKRHWDPSKMPAGESTRQRGLAGAGIDLIAASHPGGGTLILAPSDLCHALLDRPYWGIHGYDAETARHLLWNLACWSNTACGSPSYPAVKEPSSAAMDMVHDRGRGGGRAADRSLAVAAAHGIRMD